MNTTLITGLLVASLLAVPALMPASQASHADCGVPDWLAQNVAGVPDVHNVAVEADEYVAVSFRYDQPTTRSDGIYSAWRWRGTYATSLSGSTLFHSSERVLLSMALEDRAGDVLNAVGYSNHISGIGVSTGPAAVSLDAADFGCGIGAAKFASSNTFEEGEVYTAVAVGSSEKGSSHAMIIPETATITSVARGPAVSFTEADLNCLASLTATAWASGSWILERCEKSFEISGNAYGAVMARNSGEDQDHQAVWELPSGEKFLVDGRFDIAGERAGTHTLTVDRYETVFGGVGIVEPFIQDVTERIEERDVGVFGVLADVEQGGARGA